MHGNNINRTLVYFLLLGLLGISCQFVTNLMLTPETPPTLEAIEPEATTEISSQGNISAIVFCEDVTDEGECINQGEHFSAGITTIWAYFTYENMQDGQSWGRLWEHDGDVYVESLDEAWEDGESGWLAYSISEDIPLSGHFTFTIYLEDQPVQSASFTVDPPEESTLGGFPAFGPIQFASGVTDDVVPVGAATSFTAGTSEVYAIFPFINMRDGQAWRREWLYNGAITAERDLEWEEGQDGITYASLIDDEGLDTGSYALNLYIEGQLVRSAGFEVVGALEETTGGEPLSAEELIDPDLMPAWDMLVNSDVDLLSQLADLVLSFQIEVRMDDSLESGVDAVYRYDEDTCTITESAARTPGSVLVSQEAWNEQSWEEVASSIAHELTHAYQHLQTGYRCGGCSIQKEYEAFFVTIYALEELGRWDIVQDKYGSLVDDEGNIYGDTLWEVLQETYSECPEY